MIYLDNAATSFPKPRSVAEAVRTAVTRYGANPGRSGHALSMEAGEQVFSCREELAALLGMPDPARIVFTANCTAALNLVIKGTLYSGDHVVISGLEHNASARPVHALASRGKITYTVARVFPEDDDKTLESFAAAFRPETRLCICTMASNVFGIMPPVERLGALCRSRGIPFCVDAAQTAGLLPFDFPWDYACLAGHKGLYGPAGVGVLAVRGDLPLPLLEGGTGSRSSSLDMPDFLPDALESGTLNTVGILGLRAGLRFLRSVTPEKLYRNELALTARAYALLSRIPGVSLYTPPPTPGRNAPVLAFNVDGMDSEDAVSRLDSMGFALRGGFHCAPLAHQALGTKLGAVRISPGAFNTQEDMERLAEAVRRLAKL